jgi:hypothetical protein
MVVAAGNDAEGQHPGPRLFPVRRTHEDRAAEAARGAHLRSKRRQLRKSSPGIARLPTRRARRTRSSRFANACLSAWLERSQICPCSHLIEFGFFVPFQDPARASPPVGSHRPGHSSAGRRIVRRRHRATVNFDSYRSFPAGGNTPSQTHTAMISAAGCLRQGACMQFEIVTADGRLFGFDGLDWSMIFGGSLVVCFIALLV